MSFDRVAELSLACQDMLRGALNLGVALLIDTVRMVAAATGAMAGRVTVDCAFATRGTAKDARAVDAA